MNDLLTELKAARDADVVSLEASGAQGRGLALATWGAAISIAERHQLTASLHGNTWPVDPAELLEAIRGRVIDLIGDRPATQEVVDMAWDLVHHVGLRVPPAEASASAGGGPG